VIASTENLNFYGNPYRRNHRAPGGRLPPANRLDGPEQEIGLMALRGSLCDLDGRCVLVCRLVGVVGATRSLRIALRPGPDECGSLVDAPAVEGPDRLCRRSLRPVVDHRGRQRVARRNALRRGCHPGMSPARLTRASAPW